MYTLRTLISDGIIGTNAGSIINTEYHVEHKDSRYKLSPGYKYPNEIYKDSPISIDICLEISKGNLILFSSELFNPCNDVFRCFHNYADCLQSEIMDMPIHKLKYSSCADLILMYKTTNDMFIVDNKLLYADYGMNKEIRIPEGIKEVFMNMVHCPAAESLTFPDSIEIIRDTKDANIHDYTELPNLEELNLANVRKITHDSFKGLTNKLSYIKIPDTIKFIAKGAFKYSKLSDEDTITLDIPERFRDLYDYPSTMFYEMIQEHTGPYAYNYTNPIKRLIYTYH